MRHYHHKPAQLAAMAAREFYRCEDKVPEVLVGGCDRLQLIIKYYIQKAWDQGYRAGLDHNEH